MKILLCTPAYGGQVTEGYFQSIIKMLNVTAQYGIQVDIMTLVNESLITRGRNECLATFLAGEWDKLLFVDADIEFQPEHLLRLATAPYDVTCTPYPMKGLDWDQMAAVGQNGGDADALRTASRITVVNTLPDSKEDGNGFSTVLDGGTGFMCITRSAFEKIIAALPEIEYEAEQGKGTRWSVFDCIIREGRYLSEDYTFCRRWQDLGGEIWCDVASPTLVHQGSYKFGK